MNKIEILRDEILDSTIVLQDRFIGVSRVPQCGKKFRIQNQRIMLIYKNHISKKDIKSFFELKFKSGFDELIIAHEKIGFDYNRNIGTDNDIIKKIKKY